VLSKSRLIVVVSMMLLIALALISITTTAQSGATPSQYYTTQVILNLENGQQYFGAPHVYQGDNYGTPTSQWPVYYGPSNASQYWSLAGISSDQPVLELVPGLGSGGAMFWSEYYSGGSITITIQATASIVWVGTPFQVYLFLKPTMWGISPQYNYTIPYESIYPSPVASDVISPQSSTSYLIIQWEPYWQFGYTQSNATGQWNVWVVSNPSGNNASVGPYPSPNLGSYYAGWGGIGTGAFQPNPGDLIDITVTYDPSTNTLTGIAYDINTTQSANFTLNLNGYYTPPTSSNYTFGVGAGTGWGYANWALLYVATTQQTITPSPPSLSSLSVKVFNVLGRPATTVPGVVYGVLYSSSGFGEVAFMNSSGYLNFYGVSPGTYTLEVYHYPNTGLNLTEYWGSETINVKPGNNTATFTRDEPWIYNLQASVSNGEIVVTVTVNGTVTSPTPGEIELWVTNNPSLASPYSPSNVTYFTINPGLNEYTFYYPANQTGTYYVYAALLTYNNTYTVTDQWNWTLIISPKGSLTFYVPVWYNGTTYYVYWSVKGISVTSTEGNVISSTIGVSPNQFLQLFLQLNSSHAIMKFEGITYQNGTPITNTTQEELILGYLYLWLLLGSNWKTVVQNYGTTSAGYQFLNVTIQSGIPTVIETANGITNAMYYLLDFLEVVEGLIEGNNHISVLAKVTVTFFKVLKLYSSHNLQDEFGNQKAQEIEELFKQYGLQASNYVELLQEFSSLPPSEQENLIASLYEITTGQTLPNPTLKAADILINRIISEGVFTLVKSFADSLYESLINQGVDQYFASLVSQNFELDLQDEISDSILSSEGLTSFLLLTVADIIENAWNIPNEVVYSVILALINNLNYNYEYIENYINAYETSNVANLTLASQLYSAMILNNLWWSEMWHNFYILPRPPWLHPNNDYLLYSNEDYINAIDMILVLSNLMGDASFTLKWGYISPIFILDQNIYTPIVPQYSSSWNSFLEHLISLK